MTAGDKSDQPTESLASLRRQRRPAAVQRPSQPDLFSTFEIDPPEEPGAPAVVASQPEPAPPVRRIWTVADLVGDIRQRTEAAYQDIWVEGEISNCRPAASGHVYFTLKDGDAQLPVVLFRRQAQLLRFRPQDGLAVLVRGRISVYESRGQLQLIAETMEPRGAGALQLAFEQLKRRLAAEGFFEASRKRPLPAFPHCIGVITSPTGAVIRDIVTVIRRRHAHLSLLIYPALMQGPSCASSVADGVAWFNAEENAGRVDLILIARGGGSIEDLSGFNDESLARAIAASTLPVVSAIGHETDFTISDFVADLRAATPSAAAELITAAQHRVEDRVRDLGARLHRAIDYRLILARQRYTRISADSVLARLRDSMYRREQRLDDLGYRLEASMQRRLRTPSVRLAALSARLERQAPTARLASAHRRFDKASEGLARAQSSIIAARAMRLSQLSTRLEALSPLAVLNRGYSLIYMQQEGSERLLHSAGEIAAGQQIRARLASGELTAIVSETQQ